MEKCFNCGKYTDSTYITDDDVELCEACYREVPSVSLNEFEGDKALRGLFQQLQFKKPRLAIVRDSALERVTEAGPCPACGQLTVKDDEGGTRCLRCADERHAGFPLGEPSRR